jgi:DNA-binding beta-propeller fold protein YncE
MTRSSLTAVALGLALGAATTAAAQSFVNFESGHVRPLALSPDGTQLYAVNTPDNRLTIFDVAPGGLELVAEVPVGMEPVAVATRTGGGGAVEAWVVNQLSDSVSIVRIDDADPALSRVVRTLHVGDEPRDVVFAGSGGDRAFITTAHRGQNRPGDPQLTTEGIGRADVWVFDADATGAALGGTPLTIVQLFGDTPRALAASPDGSTVYAAVFHSGTRTTTVNERVVTPNGGLPPPPAFAPPGAPPVGLIVKRNPLSGLWLDELGRNWTAQVAFDLPDQDVFEIDANANPPSPVGAFVGVGAIVFNMAVRPGDGKVYVSNTDARNHVRFEGVVGLESPEQGVRGHIAESRITVLDGGITLPRHLNPHIDYDVPTGDDDEVEESLAFPMDMAFSSDGDTLYVVAFGSEAVAVLDADALDDGIVTRDVIHVGGGPSGLALDEANDRLYVMSRFTHRVDVVTNLSDPDARGVTNSVSLRFDPSPQVVKHGRRILYDAKRTSGHGDNACASCHIFGDLDDLAWDLGDPTGEVVQNPNPFRTGSGSPFHPLKGPMTTQSLRGMADAGPMHWRGDRTGGTIGEDPLDEELAFKAFNPAFVGLLGREEELTDAEMQAFTDFILTVRYPPNPIAPLDDVPTAAQANGRDLFIGATAGFPTDGGNPCVFCHRLPFGTDGFSSNEGETQEFKIPHLRNLYTKIGMFGVPANGVIPGTGFLGDQVRGFGVLHDGSVATAFNFISAQAFIFPPPTPNVKRRNVEAFMLALDTGLASAVGQQVTATPSSFNDASLVARVDLLRARADAGRCDLVAKGNIAGQARAARYLGSNQWRSDRQSDPLFGTTALLGFAATPGQESTITCVPPGLGARMGIDRDEDGVFDRDELDAGSDPADPTSVPGVAPAVLVQATKLTMKDDNAPPVSLARRKITFTASTKNDPPANRVVVPALGGAGDPTVHGATLRVYNSNGTGEQTTVELDASDWLPLGNGYVYRGPDSEGPVKSVKLTADKLSVKGGKSLWSYTLDEPAQGRITVRLTIGTGADWCAESPAKTKGTPPSSGKNDLPDKFVGASKAPAPVGCPVPPAG